MNWVHININHQGKSVEVSDTPRDDSIFGHSSKKEYLNKVIKECNIRAEYLAHRLGYHLLPMKEG